MKREEGDLSRLVYLPEAASYRKNFVKSSDEKRLFDDLPAVQLPLRKKYKIITLGDSFSEKRESGFQQQLVKLSGFNLLHLNSQMHPGNNQFNSLAGLANGDLDSSTGVRYVIFEIVERSVYYRVREYDSGFSINQSDIGALAENVRREKNMQQPYPIDQLLKFPLQNIFFHLGKKSGFDQIRRFQCTDPMFSISNNEIPVYEEDINCIPENNKKITAEKFNAILNAAARKLRIKGITLIVFVAPDKFDFYFEDFIRENKLPKPLLLENIRSMPKEYLYLDMMKHLNILKQKGQKDIYLFDDTHWSIATNIHVADGIIDMMKYELGFDSTYSRP
jgi:hypothetical protein